jgi:hypothetical protein
MVGQSSQPKSACRYETAFRQKSPMGRLAGLVDRYVTEWDLLANHPCALRLLGGPASSPFERKREETQSVCARPPTLVAFSPLIKIFFRECRLCIIARPSAGAVRLPELLTNAPRSPSPRMPVQLPTFGGLNDSVCRLAVPAGRSIHRI